MIVTNEPCPACREMGHDKTGNHLLVFEDGNKFCKKSEYHKDGKPYREINAVACKENNYQTTSFEEILEFTSARLESRKIPVGVCNIYGVRVSYSEEAREVDHHYYPIYSLENKLIAFKVRKLPKKFWIVGERHQRVQLFGQNLEAFKNERRIVVAGGEEDALASYTMTGQILSSPIPAVAPAYGETLGSFEAPEVLDYLRSFETVYLALDNDDAGKKLTQSLVDLLGFEKVKLVAYSEKDVSDMLTKGKAREYVNAVLSAKVYKPTGIVSINDLDDSIVDPVEWGLDYPFEGLTRITYGARGGEVIGIGAAPGAGKTTFIRQLQQHFIFKHNQRIAVYSLEEGVNETAKHIIGSVLKKPIHLPDCEYDIEEARRVKHSFKDRLYLFNCEEYHDWEDIISSIRYFSSIGVKYFFIDPLSALVAHLPPSEANTWLSSNMYKFELLAKSLDVTFYHTNHLNNPQGGKDHGAGGKVYGSQFSGSRAQWKFSTSLWGLERNQLEEDEFKKNIITVSSIKSRMSGDTSSFKLIYNKETGVLEENEEMIKRILSEEGE